MDENKQNNVDVEIDDGFFDDVPQPPTHGGVDGTDDGFFHGAPQGNAERRMTDVGQGYPSTPARKQGKGKKIGKIIGAIGAAIGVFACGMLTTWFCLDKEIRTLIKVKNTIDKEYYQDISDSKFYGALFAAINDDVLDPYSQYMTADEYATMQGDLAGNRSGLGLYFTQLHDGETQRLVVYRAVENSPAERAGLKGGDEIIGFGKEETQLTPCHDFDSELKPFLDARAANEPFCLQVARGTETLVLTMCKEHYVESYVSYRTKETSYGFSGERAATFTEKGNALSCLPDDAAYIRLTQFTGNAASGFDRVMQQFKADGKKDLVLDLRSNGGGYMDYLQYIAKYFCKNATGRNPAAVVADYGERQEYFYAADNVYDEYFAEDSRIVVLADSGTASASECLLGVMLDYGAVAYEDVWLAERNGVARTYGKGIMQTTFYLDAQKKDFLKLTTAELRWPVTGKSIHARGLLPEDGAQTAAERHVDERELEDILAAVFA